MVFDGPAWDWRSFRFEAGNGFDSDVDFNSIDYYESVAAFNAHGGLRGLREHEDLLSPLHGAWARWRPIDRKPCPSRGRDEEEKGGQAEPPAPHVQTQIFILLRLRCR
jgi:hypothetical protein